MPALLHTNTLFVDCTPALQHSSFIKAFMQSHPQAACPCCGTIVISESELELHGQAVRCSNRKCDKRFCVDCEVEWHKGLTCNQYKGAEVDTATQSLLNQGKRCPGCGQGIIHYFSHQCHHIRPGGGCPTCHHHFCYVCLGSFYHQKQCQEKGCVSPACLTGNLSRCTRDTCNFSGSSFCRDGCGCPPCPDCRPGVPCKDRSGSPICPGCRVCQAGRGSA